MIIYWYSRTVLLYLIEHTSLGLNPDTYGIRSYKAKGLA